MQPGLVLACDWASNYHLRIFTQRRAGYPGFESDRGRQTRLSTRCSGVCAVREDGVPRVGGFATP